MNIPGGGGKYNEGTLILETFQYDLGFHFTELRSVKSIYEFTGLLAHLFQLFKKKWDIL